MSDPSRRPSNERVRLPHIETRIAVQCRTCLGDGWVYPSVAPWRKGGCGECDSTGKTEILLIEKRDNDVVIGGVA